MFLKFADLPKEIQISKYADDMTVYTKSTILEVASHLMENTSEIITKNLIDTELELFPQKTKLVIFNKRDKNTLKVLSFLKLISTLL